MISTSRSMLAPIVVAAPRPSAGAPTLSNALLAAANSVPTTYEPYTVNVGGVFKRTLETRYRTHVVHAAVGDKAGDYNVLVGHAMQPALEAAQRGATRYFHWMIGLRVFTSDPFEAFPAETDRVGVLETDMVRVTRHGMVGAVELGLVRHLWLATLRAHYPGLTVHGSRGDWSDAWPVPLTDPAPTT